jgi:hypothetical protein
MAEQIDRSSAELRNAGDVNIEKVRVVSLANDASIDIKNQVIGVQIFEDMFSPFITGSLIIKDSQDLIGTLPMAGMEYLDLKIFTPTLDSSLKDRGIIQGNFYIYKISDREYLAEKSVVYQIHFISAEALTDMNVKMSRPFEGKISDLATILVRNKNCLDSDTKNLVLEETKNNVKFISNYWSPVKCLHYISEQAQNSNGSSTYVFFENRVGFNFVSLDYLNQQDEYHKFKYGTSNNDVLSAGGSTRVVQRDFAKILELSVPNSFDFMNRIRTGTYTSKQIIHDLTTKRYKTLHYDYLAKFQEGKENRLNKFPITTEQVAARVNATIMYNEISNQLFTGFGDVSNVKVQQDRVSRMKQSEAFKITIKVNGRTDYTVGLKVYVDINTAAPTAGSDTPDEIKDRMYSGNYLIAAINHVIDKQKHECYMELIKDTLEFDLKTGKAS